MKEATLRATPREPGKGAARAARRGGYTPAVVYGHGLEGLPIKVDARELGQVLGRHVGLILLQVEGHAEPHPTMIKDVQVDRIKGELLHVDFYRTAPGEPVRTTVPVVLRGGDEVAKRGGIVEHHLHALEVECLPADLPEAIEVDVSAFQVGQHLGVTGLKLPPGVKALSDPADLVVVIDAPKATEEVAPDTTRAEPELAESKGKKEEKEEE